MDDAPSGFSAVETPGAVFTTPGTASPPPAASATPVAPPPAPSPSASASASPNVDHAKGEESFRRVVGYTPSGTRPSSDYEAPDVSDDGKRAYFKGHAYARANDVVSNEGWLEVTGAPQDSPPGRAQPSAPVPDGNQQTASTDGDKGPDSSEPQASADPRPRADGSSRPSLRQVAFQTPVTPHLSDATKAEIDNVREGLASGRIKPGEKNTEVKKMQEDLMADGFQLAKYGADGVIGRETLTTMHTANPLVMASAAPKVRAPTATA